MDFFLVGRAEFLPLFFCLARQESLHELLGDLVKCAFSYFRLTESFFDAFSGAGDREDFGGFFQRLEFFKTHDGSLWLAVDGDQDALKILAYFIDKGGQGRPGGGNRQSCAHGEVIVRDSVQAINDLLSLTDHIKV